MTHPGVGPITALATDVFLGDPKRFVDGKALASYQVDYNEFCRRGQMRQKNGGTCAGMPARVIAPNSR
jgi:hypothetical protein